MNLTATTDALHPVATAFARASVRVRAPRDAAQPTVVIQKGGRPVHPLQDARLSREARDALVRVAEQPLVEDATRRAQHLAEERARDDGETETDRAPHAASADERRAPEPPAHASPPPPRAEPPDPPPEPPRGRLIDLIA